jgi:predicted PurR-regulated permease PerM
MLSIILIAVLVLPTLFTQTISFLNSIDTFIQEMVSDYNIDLGNLGVFLDSSIEEFSKSIGTYVTEGAMKTISMSLGFLTNMVIVLSVAIYFLFDFNSIRNFIKLFLIKRSQRLFNYVKLLDNEITNYFKGLVKITIIAYFEYTIAFLIIGHPNALLIGFLAAPANFIPFIGGFINNILAVITAFVVGPALFIKTIILSFILANADSYLINPTVFGKSNKLHPLLVIFAVFASATVFGVVGIFIALPLAIILSATYLFYKDDIIDTFKKDN